MTSDEMEPDIEPPLLPLQGSRPSAIQSPSTMRFQALSQRRDPARSPVSPRAPHRESPRVKRPPPVASRGGDRSAAGLSATKSRMRILPTPLPTKPLLPVTERKSQEEHAPLRRPGNLSEGDKWDLTLDGGSAGREGRQFAVANVGNNGRIYLRPTVRPANQRYPQPQFVFPITPPGTAGLGGAGTDKEKRPDMIDNTQLHQEQWTPSQVPSTPTTQRLRSYYQDGRTLSRPGHRRALSDSTIHDSSAARESDPGGFKIVITQPGEDQRPKTLEDINPARAPLLAVAIPSWKLGTPRFSTRGTPFIRGSSYAPTEEFRSSSHSLLRSGARTPRPALSIASRQASSIVIPPSHLGDPQASPLMNPAGLLSTEQNIPRSTFVSTQLVIEPAMFDSLTFQPTCDDRAIVRYSSTTGAVTAATPPRLVAEITSPSFLDYELLSDFFLTFRAFLEPSDLLRMLFARLRWSLARGDEMGMVVRVRTFVALRHWTLNYFVDDFVCEYDMRVAFCDLLNNLMDDLSQDVRARRVQTKILAELKKCWRRVCAQFWDGAEFDTSLPPHAPIAPGGIPGHRNGSLNPEFWQKYLNDGPPRLDSVFAPLTSNPPDVVETSFYQDVAKAGEDEDEDEDADMNYRPGTPEIRADNKDELEEIQASPASVNSVDVVSCSFPTKNMKFASAGSSYPLAAHPVDPSAYNNLEPIATTPRALVGKRVRPQPQQSHKRNNSVTDSLREHSTTLEKLLQKNTETLLSLTYGGSLVRGDLFPPGQAFVEILPPSTAGGGSRQTTVFEPYPDESHRDKGLASAMSGQGMRKLIGSVRRALSTRGQDASPTQDNFINISPIGPRGATTNRLPGTPIVPQSRARTDGARPPVRIDLLGAKIAEQFKAVIREDAAAEAALRGFHGSVPSTPTTVQGTGERQEYSAAHMDTTLLVPQAEQNRPASDAGLTTGSKSILIFDDTMQLPVAFPAMTGALPAVNSSVEAFAETFMPQAADPTPPNTPPGQHIGTPRRSSHLLGNHITRSVKSAEALPPFVPDLASLEHPPIGRASSDGKSPSVDLPRPSSDLTRQSFINGPAAIGRRGHDRHRSSRSLRSSGTMGRRRYASFHSGIAPRKTTRSFDATTYSDHASMDDKMEAPIPPPLRVLRRRPGGDLRAVSKVGDLDHHAALHKSRSVGSITTYTESLRSSFLQSPGTAPDSSGFDRTEAFSLGIIAEKPKRRLSLLSTQSSKPIMRPSFEAEAQKLAQIPDDADDDGGVESALAKLEGKFEKKSFKLSMEPKNATSKDLGNVKTASPLPEEDRSLTEQKRKRRNNKVVDEGVVPPAPSAEDTPTLSQSSFLDVPSKGRYLNEEVGSFLSDSSTGSYSSTPLLQRGLTDECQSRSQWTNRSVLQGPGEEGTGPADEEGERDSQYPSFEIVKKSESLEKIKPGDTMPTMERRPDRELHQSFLNVDSDEEYELSSELSDSPNEDEDDLEAFPPLRSGATLTRVEPRLSQDSAKGKPGHDVATLPVTMPEALAPPLEAGNVPGLHSDQVWDEKPLPPTPGITPTATVQREQDVKPPQDSRRTNGASRDAANFTEDEITRKNAAHLPFILAFDSEVLAQQFTLIEKDALNEIDWRELIEMRWKNAGQSDDRSWVNFLRNTDARGVEVVIARFNIMVNWATSEIVLTQDMEERARCIIKYIHIAANCRRYRNFATMSQIAIALTRTEVTRLTKTWRMVPSHDIRTLRDLEALVSPARNFYSLRAEMEGGGLLGSDMGCIPFVGVYTQDLILNSQKPSEIASSPTTAPLANFERCRIAASVVKTLLRLLEASTLYNFQPIEGITERCLWMCALPDEDIRRNSRHLE